MTSPETRKPWERARDISDLITFLTSDSRFGPRINSSRIAVIGHSLGGNSAMALAGARFDVERFVKDCEAYPEDHDCHWYLDHAIDRDPSLINQVEQSLRDARVSAVIGLDVGFARGFTPESLAGVSVPVLLIESGRHVAGRPRGWYLQYLIGSLPTATTTYLEIPDASHFSFISECKPGALDILKFEGRGDEVVCMDGSGRSREDLHAEVSSRIDHFLRRAGF
jgi:predicted dienelactone hydrolase